MHQQAKTQSLTQSSVIVRQVQESDIQLLSDWTFQLHQHEDDNQLVMHDNFKNNLSHWLQSELNNPNALILIAEINLIPVGFIFASSIINDNGFLAEPIKGIINLLWVDESHRNNHVAETLLDNTEKCLKSSGINYIECNYTIKNNLAESFWQKNNYVRSSITARKLLK